MSHRSTLSRRTWLANASGASLGYFFSASAVSATRAANRPNNRLRFAGIGVGGKGESDIAQAAIHGDVIAVCDISDQTLEAARAKYVGAKGFIDYRQLMDDPVFRDVDGVLVSTADHSHAPAAMRAMERGKHVYVQKPMAHTVEECRAMARAAEKYGVVTQMGNQGTAVAGFRRGVEVLRSGVLGTIREVHVWTDRPIWPQAPAIKTRFAVVGDPKAHGIHWDEFLGPAEYRPFAANVYTPFNWRGWWDFGTGAIGDMACHCANLPFMGLNLGYAQRVSATTGAVTADACPEWARVVIEFAGQESKPPIRLTWYEGKRDGQLVTPEPSVAAQVLEPNEKLIDNGAIVIGDNGCLYSPSGQNQNFVVTGSAANAVSNLSTPESLPLPASGESNDHSMKTEWVNAIRENNPKLCLSNFGYAAKLSEAFLLGNVAIRSGKNLEFDADHVSITNVPSANQYLTKTYRQGWELPTL